MTAASPLRVVVAASRQLKRGAPDGAGWARLTAAGCVEWLCSLALKGKVAASPQFYMPLTRPLSTAIAVPLPHRWGRQVRYGIDFLYHMA